MGLVLAESLSGIYKESESWRLQVHTIK